MGLKSFFFFRLLKDFEGLEAENFLSVWFWNDFGRLGARIFDSLQVLGGFWRA